MSMLPLPFILGSAPHHLVDQDFGVALTPEELLTAVIAPIISKDYYRPWRQMASRHMGATIESNKDKFQVSLDVQHFSPDEISVKTVDGHVIIEGKHEEKKDHHGYISRQFTRRYSLPENCDPATVESKLSSDGVLTIIAPKVALTAKNERMVPIAKTGPVRKEMKDASQPAIETDTNGTTT